MNAARLVFTCLFGVNIATAQAAKGITPAPEVLAEMPAIAVEETPPTVEQPQPTAAPSAIGSNAEPASPEPSTTAPTISPLAPAPTFEVAHPAPAAPSAIGSNPAPSAANALTLDAPEPDTQSSFRVESPFFKRQSRVVRRAHFDIPALDVSENIGQGFWPSMRQSMALSKDTYYLFHSLVLSFPYPKWVPQWLGDVVDITALTFLDYYLVYFPPAHGWMHEEWHRAVMSRRRIHSFNDVYNLEIGAELINVSHERDEDLARLKREHPAEQVRMSAAGLEGDVMAITEFDKDRFFGGARASTVVTEWLNLIGVVSYFGESGPSSDETTREHEALEGARVEVRDFTGLDPNGWVYDLFRPDEPYSARGVHPSGVGIDRYRSWSDLTARERRFLRAQLGLSWLNVINPQLFGLYAFEVGTARGLPVSINASVQHLLAPFDYSVGLNLFAKAGPYGAFASLQAFVADRGPLPGLSLELVRYPLPFLDATLTPRMRLWLQPKNQRFFAKSGAPGGALEVRANVPLVGPLEFYLEASAKSAGWVPGNVYLDPNVNLRSGFEATIF